MSASRDLSLAAPLFTKRTQSTLLLYIAYCPGVAHRAVRRVERYDVSAATAVLWVRCFRGRCGAKPRGGSTSPSEMP